MSTGPRGFALGAAAATLVLVAVGAGEPARATRVADARDHGARGDGVSDDRAAIQATIDAVAAAGGGVAWLGPGTYRVTIDRAKGHALTVRAGVRLEGAGRARTSIRLAAAQGRYSSVLHAGSEDASDFALRDLTLDANARENPGDWSDGIDDAAKRNVLIVWRGSRVVVERCRFTDVDGVQVVELNGDVRDAWITDNVFDEIGGAALDHDHSSVYTLVTEGATIAGNVFRAKGGGPSPGAYTAIETHGSRTSVSDNLVVGYRQGINLTGIADATLGVRVTNNAFERVLVGVLVWTRYWGGLRAGPALIDATVAHNRLLLAPELWPETEKPRGIALDAQGDAGFRDLRIVGNVIDFGAPGARADAPGPEDLAGGIDLWLADESPESERLEIAGNRIAGALAAGIRVDLNVSGLRIVDNVVAGCGASASRRLHDGFRAAILLGGEQRDVRVSGNRIEDPRRRLRHVIHCLADPVRDAVAWGNEVAGTDIAPFTAASEGARTFRVR